MKNPIQKPQKKNKRLLSKMLNQIDSKLQDEEAKEVTHSLNEVSEAQRPVLFTLQNSEYEFKSVLLIKNNYALILQPHHLSSKIHKGSVLCLDYLEKKKGQEEHHIIALKILLTHIRLNDHQMGMVCKIPKRFLENHYHQRLRKRYDMSARNDCWLRIGRHAKFKVIDFSKGGVRFELTPKTGFSFNKNQLFNHTLLEIGDFSIGILFLRVKSIQTNMISCRIGLSDEMFHKMDKVILLVEQLTEEAKKVGMHESA